MKIRIGFIGTGQMGRSHIETFLKFCAKRSVCAAICDLDESSVSLAREIVPDATVYGHSDQLLGCKDIDAVVISTSNHTHAELMIASLESAKHVFCEKPIATTMADCAKVKLASDASDRICMIGHELRYGVYFQKIKSLIDDDAIGQLRTVWCKEFRPPFIKKIGDWIQDARLSGGALVEKNCHHFDLMNWWVGSSLKTVSAFGRSCEPGHVPPEHRNVDHATVSFEYNNGVTGTLMLSMIAPDRDLDCLEMGVIGDKGMIQTSMSQNDIVVWPRDIKKDDAPTRYHIQEELTGFGGHHGFEQEHTVFLDAIEQKTKLLTNVDACLDGTVLALMAEQSIVQKKTLELS